MVTVLGFLCAMVGNAGVAPNSLSTTEPVPEEGSVLLYVGTYTRGASEGVYLLEMDPVGGSLSEKRLVAKLDNPSFLAIDPSERFLYAANEIGRYEGRPSGAVSAFAINRSTGDLTLLNQEASEGGAPCHLIVDAEGQNVLVANYGGGNVSVFPINPDGTLKPSSDIKQHEGSGPNPDRQERPHAHSINLDPTGQFAMAADLGIDKVLIYRFDPESGTLETNDPPFAEVEPGAGPRHFDFHPNGRLAYVINELQSTVTAFRYDSESGALVPFQTISTLPDNFEGSNTTADIHVHPSGNFLYGSNRGHDSIAIFAIDPDDGSLTAMGHSSTQGETPRNFGIAPGGKFLLAANQNTDNIVVFTIDPEDGSLEPTGTNVEVPAPVCLKFLRRE